MGSPSNIPPPKRPSIPDEEPTQPDLFRSKCPSCSNAKGEPQGTVEKQEWAGSTVYRFVTVTCDVCWGAKWVNREQLQRWAERQTKI